MSVASSTIPRDPIAPWAEIVPNAPSATVDDLLRLPDDGWQYEVVQGVLVRMAGSGQQATALGAKLLARLFVHVEARGLGVVTGADGVYKFPGAETGLLPDVGFYHQARQSLIKDPTKPIPFAPDFAIEVASPSQGSPEMTDKALTYISNGTGEVWIFWPESRQVDVWRSRNAGDAGDYETYQPRPLPLIVIDDVSPDLRGVFTRRDEYTYNPPVNHHPSGDMSGVLGVGNGPGIYTIRSSVVEGFTLSLDDLFPLSPNSFMP
jgi:Uma2 family endonuclease